VIVSRHHTAAKAEGEALLVVAEPWIPEGSDEDEPARETARALRAAGGPLLLVLPKRFGTPEQRHRRWLGSAGLSERAAAQRVLDAFEVDANVVRPSRAAAWRGALPAPALEAPQLVRSDVLVPLVSNEDGMLAGELVDEETGAHLVVVSDPDVLANHGLGDGQNALLVARLLERLGAAGRTVVIDETLHGHELSPSLARELFRFPLVLATLQALLAGLVLAWAALVRFGRARPPEPALGAGKGVLIESTAALLLQGGGLRHAVQAYLRAAKDVITHRLRPAATAEGAEVWLQGAAAARGRGDALAALEAAARAQEDGPRAAEAAVRTAQAIHRFRQEMTDGARRDS